MTTATVDPPRTRWRARPALAPFAHRDFALFWAAAVVSNVGTWMQSITVPYVVYRITGSATWLGLATMANLVPAIVSNPFAAALADRFDRRRVLLVTQSVQMSVAFGLFALWSAGVRSVGPILAIVIVGGFSNGINGPSWQSLVSQLVPREHLGAAVRLNSLQVSTGRTMGPFIGGFVLGAFGPAAAFAGNGATFLFVIAALLAMRPRPATRAAGGSGFAQLVDGWRYLGRYPSLLLVPFSVFVFGAFGWAVTQLAPALVDEQFHVGRSTIGVMMGLYGFGSVCTLLAMGVFADRVARSLLVRISCGMWIAALLLLSSTRSLPVGLLAVACMGVAHVLGLTTISTAIQIQVDEAYRGRTLAAYMQGMFLGAPLGSIFLGRLSELTSIETATRVAAGAQLAFLLFAVVRLQGFRGLDAERPEPRVRHRAARAVGAG